MIGFAATHRLQPQGSQVVFQALGCNFFKPALLNVDNTNGNCLPHCFQACSLQGISLLEQTQPFSEYLTGVLITTGLNQMIQHMLHLWRQDDVAITHDTAPSGEMMQRV